MEEKIKQIIEELKPALKADGGDLEFVAYDDKNKIVKVEFSGACAFCPLSSVTLKQVVEKQIKEKLPEIKEVVAI